MFAWSSGVILLTHIQGELVIKSLSVILGYINKRKFVFFGNTY